MKKIRFDLRTLMLSVVFVAIWLVAFIYIFKMWQRTDRENAAMWARTEHESADRWYWTMRSNLDRSRDSITAADYDKLRQRIDADWKGLHPKFEIPTEPPANSNE